jgi:spore germination protein YaaH
MKRSLILVGIVLLLIGGFIAFKNKVKKDLAQPINIPTTIPSITASPMKTGTKARLSLFVPYWTLSGDKIETDGFDKIIYFGITPSEQDEKQLQKFNDSLTNDTKKLLALRMTDSQENARLLGDLPQLQKIIDRTTETAVKNNMQGIVLDLELSAIPFDSTIKQINKFVSMFYAASKKNNLTFTIALYGDSFYRARPFDAKTLAQNADEIMIMAYDLNKANGNPGPNFPLGGGQKFGYDMTRMSDDFLKVMRAEKVTVIFGLFGYDWEVSEKGQAVQEAKALTLVQIKQEFIDKCEFKKCVIKQDKEAGETQIRYTDNENKDHVVWFEDMESIRQKKAYLQQKGINSFSYWAYSYF